MESKTNISSLIVYVKDSQKIDEILKNLELMNKCEIIAVQDDNVCCNG
ncbi:hypothetical protein [Campylobacter anatolicus]|nr:hypothetical protein [Campylobacter anatolicus]